MPVTTLRDLRAVRSLSIRAAASGAGLHAPHLSEIERGLRWPTPTQLEALSRFYGVSPEEWKLMLVQEVQDTKP